MSNAVDGRITTANKVRAIFCNVVAGRKFLEKGKEVGDTRYDATVVLDKAEFEHLVAKAKEVARAQWPTRDLKELKFPFTSKTKAVEDAGGRAAKKNKDVEAAKASLAALIPDGCFVFKASSKYEPQISVLSGGKIVEVPSANRAVVGKQFYNGCHIALALNFVAYVGKKLADPDGVTAYLDAAIWLADGERIGGVNQAERFKGYAGKATAEDPTENLDDEIAF